MRRLFAVTKASALGRGGIARVAQATGVSRRVNQAGLQELSDVKEPVENPPKRNRKQGTGRKSIIQKDVRLMAALKKRVEPMTRGDPESPLRWTWKSLRTLAGELAANGHPVSYPMVGDLIIAFSMVINDKSHHSPFALSLSKS